MRRVSFIVFVALTLLSCDREAEVCSIKPIDTRPDTQKMFLKGSVLFLDEDYSQYGVDYSYHYKFNELGYLEKEELVVDGVREYLNKYTYDETGYTLLQIDTYIDTDTIAESWTTYDYDVDDAMLEAVNYAADSTVMFSEVYRHIDRHNIEVSAYIGDGRNSLSRRDVNTYDDNCRKIKSDNLFPFTDVDDNKSEYTYYGDTCREDFYFNGVVDLQRYTIGQNKELPDKLIMVSDSTITDITYTYNEHGDRVSMVRKVMEDGKTMLYETKSEYKYDEFDNWIECVDTEHTVKRTIRYYYN